MKNLPLLLGTLVVTLLMVVGVAFIFSNQSGSDPDAVADASILYNQVLNTKGQSQDPQIRIVEFSDLQCPACRAAAPLVTQLESQYGDQVEVIYRHFPLVQIHTNAQQAAIFSEAAADEGKFWEMHDLLFSRQDEWSKLNGSQLDDKLVEYAQELEIDKDILLEKIQSDDIKQRVTTDIAAANSLGVNGTPTFFVNGIRTTAPQLLPTVESMLQQ